jgi:hypothetical protein
LLSRVFFLLIFLIRESVPAVILTFYSPTEPVREKGGIWELSSDCAKSIDLMHKFQGCFFVNIT